jgi:alpha-L-fucosidase
VIVAITVTVHVEADSKEQAVNHLEDVLGRNGSVMAVIEPHVDGIVVGDIIVDAEASTGEIE